MELIRKLHAVRYEVRAINCDLGSRNYCLLRFLKVDHENMPYFISVNHHPVCVFSDSPHITRTWFQRQKVKLAAQLLSRTVAAALKRAGKFNGFLVNASLLQI
uniref:Uncharacterized protein n=1 Tax=Megaselia scalaris TaxID=36166 RepID=T1GB00_MEGSC